MHFQLSGINNYRQEFSSFLLFFLIKLLNSLDFITRSLCQYMGINKSPTCTTVFQSLWTLALWNIYQMILTQRCIQDGARSDLNQCSVKKVNESLCCRLGEPRGSTGRSLLCFSVSSSSMSLIVQMKTNNTTSRFWGGAQSLRPVWLCLRAQTGHRHGSFIMTTQEQGTTSGIFLYI